MNDKVLLVDDDVDLIEQYTPVLEQAGYQVKGAYDSKEGLEAFEAFKPDVVFVDLAMEQFDSGFVLCQKLKKTQKGADTPVIIMTSAGHETGIRFSTDTAEEKKWIRADDYLEKPVAPRDLVQYLNEKIFK
ncbi:MAG: response regulator [candidate division KSB1 bacterium]|nr:response regulator [candidate division KSB1 bacterium]